MVRQRSGVVVPLLVAFAAAGALVASSQHRASAQGQGAQGPVIADGVRAQASEQGRVRVIVELQLTGRGFVPEGLLQAAQIAAQRQAIGFGRAQVVGRVAPTGSREARAFTTVPFVALELTPAGLAALEAAPNIVRVVEDTIARPSLIDSVPKIEGDQIWEAGYDGAGTAIAVLDSGVEAGHAFFGGRVTAEACFSSNTTGLSASVCPSGDVSEIGPGAAAPCALDSCLHGTHVAGIAAGNGDTTNEAIWGVARQADIAAVQVFSSIIDGPTCGGAAPCLGAFASDIIAGLEHVYGLAVGGLPLAAVNMSLGGGSFGSPCDGEPFKPAIDNLRAIGVATVVASGNNYETASMSSPACISSAVSVGSTTYGDEVSAFSNVAPFLSLLAPGEAIISSVPGGGYDAFSGTSMATPHVAGVFALMREAAPSASVDEMLAALQATALPVTDTRSWGPGTTTVGRVRAFRALASLVPVTNPAPELAATSPTVARAGLPVTLTLTGSGFNASSVVRWNGADVQTIADSITQLTAEVPAAAVEIGTALVSVFNPAPGGGVSPELPVTVLPPPSLTIDKATVGPGAPITVALENGFGNALDFLALARVTDPNNTYIQFTWVGGGVLDRTWTINAPATAGEYEFRLYLNNTFSRAATSAPFTVDASISPVPVAASMSPASALAGSAGLTLAVSGSSFRSSSVVQWNGSARPTTFVSSTSLQAQLPASDFASAGAAEVTVHTPAPGGGTSAPLTFTVIPAPELSVATTTVASGQSVTVTLTNGLGNNLDWLAFAATGAPSNSYTAFTYVGSGVTTRTWTVTAPSTPGTYEFRLFKQGSFVRLATSAPVTVEAPAAPELTVSTTEAETGQPVTMTLANGEGGSQDWLALAAVGAANGSYVAFTYVGAGVTTRTWTVNMPSTAGQYEFRLFRQGSFVRIATSQAIAVTTPAEPPPPPPPPPGGPQITVSSTTAIAGTQVTMTLTGGPGGTTDWLALSAVGAPLNSYLRFTYVGSGVTDRDWTVTMPTTPGMYEFRLYKQGTFTLLTTSPAVTVTAPPSPVLEVGAATASAGQPITVTLTNGLGGSTDWLAFARVGAPNNSYVAFTYVGAGVTTRTWTVTAPSTAGDYEFRLFRQGTFTRIATSAVVTVEPAPPPTLTVDRTLAAPGEQVTVTMTNGPGGGTDWLAFARTDAPDNTYTYWVYVGAGVTSRTWTVTMPSATGTYEFRFYKQASFVRLATSEAVSVGEAGER